MSAERDRELLRRFEPVIRYTRGERFYPMDAELYIRASALWVLRPDGERVRLVPKGALTPDTLAEPRSEDPRAVLYLKFVEPLPLPQLAAYSLQNNPHIPSALGGGGAAAETFRAGRGRLARVGYVPRLVDALFTLSLLARGRVPGATAAAAQIEYDRLLAALDGAPYRYHGRVVREGGWVVLQYWLFYPFNNWRSGFFGVNDHEADWELVCVYLSEGECGAAAPEWVAYSSHDYAGDDLRRRWDDPELRKVCGRHPVVYLGAGSHAGYYAPGEYLAEVELGFLRPLGRAAALVRGVGRSLLAQVQGRPPPPIRSDTFHILSVPFVDYARGDGVAIGPGTERAWGEPRLLDPVPEWVSGYRGLWGLYARDPVSGEDAPAGPAYQRDGSPRRAWYDPLGWAGLDKVPPADDLPARVRGQRQELLARSEELERAAEEKGRELTGLGVQAAALQGQPHLRQLHAARQAGIAVASDELNRMRAELAANRIVLDQLARYEEQLRAGVRGPARAHIRRALLPATDAQLRLSGVAEAWAAISVGLVILGLVGIILFARQYVLVGIVALLSALVFVEAGFRQGLTRLVNSVTIGLAIAAALVLLVEFFWPIVTLVILAAAAYVIWDNLTELWR